MPYQNAESTIMPVEFGTPAHNGVYCFALNFGSFDYGGYIGIHKVKDYYGDSKYDIFNGCSGDYSDFNQLGDEVEYAVKRIAKILNFDDFYNVKFILLGHSRGGLAARAFLQSNSKFVNNISGLITIGTPHLGTKLGKIYEYMKSCYPVDSHVPLTEETKEQKERCLDDWNARNYIYESSGLDVLSPSIKYLSDDSIEINSLNSMAYNLPIINYIEIAYDNQYLGDMGRGDTIIWNAFPSETNDVSELTTTFDFSENAELYVLGDKTPSDYKGDGIVPFISQHLSNVPKIPNVLISDGWIESIDVKEEEVLHIEETQDIETLHDAIEKMKTKIMW
jgi:hypothetical protein